jgi:hypothetical protein
MYTYDNDMTSGATGFPAPAVFTLAPFPAAVTIVVASVCIPVSVSLLSLSRV